METVPPLLMNVRQAAALLGLSPRRFYALAAQGALPEGLVIRLGRAVRVSRPVLERWLGVPLEAHEGNDGR